MKAEEVLLGAFYELLNEEVRRVVLVTQHWGAHVTLADTPDRFGKRTKVIVADLAPKLVRRVYPNTVYLSTPQGLGATVKNGLLSYDGAQCVCDNCGFQAPSSLLPSAQNLAERTDPGGEITDVECPKCGALCYEEENIVPITKPLTSDDVDEDGWVTGVVEIDLEDVIKYDLEGFLDLLSERLVGNDLLSDITYSALGVDAEGMLRVEVTGDALMVFDEKDDVPSALVALAKHTGTQPTEWQNADGPSSGVGEDYYYKHSGSLGAWRVCLDQGEVDSIAQHDDD
jgi:predicted RNA-binding Zn-ribbon protein involved in translation (DUF1610 family)